MTSALKFLGGNRWLKKTCIFQRAKSTSNLTKLNANQAKTGSKKTPLAKLISHLWWMIGKLLSTAMLRLIHHFWKIAPVVPKLLQVFENKLAKEWKICKNPNTNLEHRMTTKASKWQIRSFRLNLIQIFKMEPFRGKLWIHKWNSSPAQ